MIEHKIGFQDAQVIRQIAELFERGQDPSRLKRADDVYRMGLQMIDSALEQAYD